MGIIKDKIIKLCGGYTAKEYERIEQKYQGLLDSKTDFTCTKVVNEYLRRALRDLNMYMKNTLYGVSKQEWIDKMWNVLHNNWLRLEIRYYKSGSIMPYKIDVTLDKKDEFIKVLQSGDEYDEVDYIVDNLLETD